MTEEILNELIEYAGDDYEANQQSFLNSLIEDAIEEVCCAMYPGGYASDKEFEKQKQSAVKRYIGKIKRIAQYHYDKQGKEGVVSYSESSTSASYENSGTPSSYLRGIIPESKII